MKRVRLPTLLGLFAVVCVVVGVLVWPAPKEAKAVNWIVQLQLDWNNLASRDVHATAQIFDVLGTPLSNPIILTPSQNYSQWDGIVSDGNGEPSYIVFNWDYSPVGPDLLFHWDGPGGQEQNPPCQTADIHTGVNVLWRDRIQEQ